MSIVHNIFASLRRSRRNSYTIDINLDGIPISDYGHLNGKNVGRQHSVLAVADKGLDYWNTFVRGPDEKRVLLCYDWSRFPPKKSSLPKSCQDGQRMFLNCADWLREHVQHRNGYCIWEYAYPSFYDTQAGWKSSHAQAESMRLLLRAYEVTKNERYLSVAEHALPPFRIPLEKGGLCLKVAEDAWWYLKFADKRSKKVKVLNGMMFTLLGIYEFSERRTTFAAELFRKGTGALKQYLSCFDSGSWSYYDIFGKPASIHYHKIHIKQLQLLYNYTQEAEFKAYAERFGEYLESRDKSGSISTQKR